MHKKLYLHIFICLVILITETSSSFSAPPGFFRARSQLTGGIGIRLFLGNLKDEMGTGMSFWVSEQLEYGYLGFRMKLGTSYFLTNQQEDNSSTPYAENPPYDSGLQTYTIALGPRGIIPFGEHFRLTLNIDYELLGLISNSVLKKTSAPKPLDNSKETLIYYGDSNVNHGISAGIGARYAFSIISIDLEVDINYFWGIQEPIFTGILSVGFLSNL